jgi:hypothetical protein
MGKEPQTALQLLRRDYDKLVTDYFERCDRIRELKHELSLERSKNNHNKEMK